MTKPRTIKRNVRRGRKRQTEKWMKPSNYEALEPRQLLATLGGSDSIQIVEYDLASGTETLFAMPEVSGAAEGGVFGNDVRQDPDAYRTPGPVEVDGRSVFGNDDRNFIADPHLDPYHEAGALRMQFSDGTWSFCSGTMVGPYHFLTAGHCVHDGDWITQGTVSLGRDGDDRWYGAANVTNMVSVTSWTQNADPNFDWAMIRLDRNLGDNVGWEGRWWWSSNGPLTGLDVSIAGYPSDLAGGISQAERAADEHVVWQYESTGSMLSPTSNQLRYNGTLDTFGGMSGSGVIEDRAGTGRLVVGVHAYGNGGDGSNEATRMTESMSNIIDDYRNGNWTAPADNADLVDWDSWFNQKAGDSQVASMSTTSVRPGDAFSVTTFPRNNGTLPTGAYDVSFYASTNTTISTADYLLGTVSMGSLGEFAWDTSTLNIDIAEDMPAGTYNVGWILDSGNTVTEFLNGNNTGYITANQLVVTQPLPLNMSGHEGQAFFGNTTTLGGVAAVSDSLSFDANLNVAGDIDSYLFSVETTGSYTISGGDFGNSVNPVIAVYDQATGNRIGFDNDSGINDDGQVTLNLNVWTPYIVAIADWTGTTIGDVSIDIEGTTAWSSSNVPLDGMGDGEVSGTLNVVQDTDFFDFTTPANVGTSGEVVVTPRPGSGLDAWITLWDGDGNFIQSRNFAGAEGAETLTLSGLVAGEEYRVGVQSNTFGSSGIFDVAVNLDTVIFEPSGIDFGPAGSAQWQDFPVISTELYAANPGYGWTQYSGLIPLLESRGNDLIRDKISVRNGTFVIDVDNGVYDVDISLGVVKKADPIQITVEGQEDTFTPLAGPNVVRSYVADVVDGQLTLEFDGLAGLNNRINVAGITLNEIAGRFAGGGSDDSSNSSAGDFSTFFGDLDKTDIGGNTNKNSVRDAIFSNDRKNTVLTGSVDLGTQEGDMSIGWEQFGIDDADSFSDSLNEFSDLLVG